MKRWKLDLEMRAFIPTVEQVIPDGGKSLERDQRALVKEFLAAENGDILRSLQTVCRHLLIMAKNVSSTAHWSPFCHCSEVPLMNQLTGKTPGTQGFSEWWLCVCGDTAHHGRTCGRGSYSPQGGQEAKRKAGGSWGFNISFEVSSFNA